MNKKILLLLIVFLYGFCIQLKADDIWVDPSNIVVPGLFYTNIQDALDWVEADQPSLAHIYVSSDTYNENIIIPSDLHIILEGVKDSTRISGDDTGQAIVTIENPHTEFQMFGFIIECNHLNRGFYIENYNVDPEYNLDVNENRESEWEPTHENDDIFHELLYDIDIYEGYKTAGSGAGVLITNSYYFKFLNIDISDCSAGIMNINSYSGGGIYFDQCYNMKTELININDCSASGDGGGMCFFSCYQYEGNSFIEGFNISNCQAGEYGGGVSIVRSGQIKLSGFEYPYQEESSNIYNCDSENGSGIAHVAISQYPYNDLILRNVVINRNSADNNGGGLYCNGLNDLSMIRIYTSKIYSNNAYNGGGIYIYCEDNVGLHIIGGTEIYDNSALNYGGGIYCSNSIISNISGEVPSPCYIYNNEASEGGGIYSNDGTFGFNGMSWSQGYGYDEDSKTIEIYNNTASERGGGVMAIDSDGYIWNTILSDNTANDGAGIYSINPDIELSNIDIYANSATRFGGGLYCNQSFPDIDNPIIIYDNVAQDGAGIFCEGTVSNMKNVVVLANSAEQYGGGIYCMENSNVTISNITVAYNTASEGSGVYTDGYISVKNSILWDILYERISGAITATYCDVMNGWPGNGNIDGDPCFTDITNLDYALLQTSPCIDAGDPNSDPDPDYTRVDMGFFTATLETYEFSSEDINWSSLPVLNPNKINAYDFFEPLIQNQTLKEVRYTDELRLYYRQQQGWINDIGDLQTVDGYRVEMYESDLISLYGYKVSPETPIELIVEEEKAPEFYPMGYHNWIGYFLTYSQSPQDAFANVWDNLTFIKADDYTLRRKWNSNEWWGAISGPVSVDYGKSYAVGVLEDCSFTWNQSPFHIEEYNKTGTVLFTYEETMNYMPIFVDSAEAFNGIDEIGVFLENECIGASVVEGYPVFIPAYVDNDTTLTKGSNELTFQIASYDKGGVSSISVFLYNETQNVYTEKPVVLNKNSYAIVRLGSAGNTEPPVGFALYQNYPNPVLGTTTISFTLPEDHTEADIKIYNIKGQLVKELGFRTSDGGFNSVWDCTDDYNKPVSNGIYFYKVTSGEDSELKKMIIMR